MQKAIKQQQVNSFLVGNNINKSVNADIALVL